MNAQDQLKLTQLGITIIRARDFQSSRKGVIKFRYEIFAKTIKKPEWHSYEWQFKSKSERDLRMRTLRNNSKTIIED